MRLLTDYPWYYALCCILIGVGYGVLLYWMKDSKSPLSRRLRWILGVLRSIVVSALALLPLAPMVRIDATEQEKPIILIVQDRSESVTIERVSDSLWQLKMDALEENLSADYDVQRFDYGGVVTDMSKIMGDLRHQFAHRNVGAMILTGDGLWNSGCNPASCLDDVQYPIFTLALGDTTRRKDASIGNIRCPRIAYKGSAFPVEVTVTASLLKGDHRRLSVVRDGRVLFSKFLDYDADSYSVTEQLTLDADKEGVQRFVVRIEASEGEATLQNNERSFSIEVVDGHQKIAIVSGCPHPDVAALKHAIEGNPNYEVTSFLAKDFKGDAKDYSLLILHQIPSRNGARLDVGDVPCIYVLGGQSDLAQFNSLRSGVEINTRLSKTNEVSAVGCEGFAPFSLDEASFDAIEEMPPLTSPFGEYRLEAGMQSLFTARIGNVDSKQPLIALGQQHGVRHTVIAGEGLWRWRLADYQNMNTHEHFDELVNKLVTYTSMRVDKERFRLVAKSIYRQDEEVIIEAELYDENYELTNIPDATLKLNGKDYSLNRSGNRYCLNLGRLEPEAYGCQGVVVYNGKEYRSNCNFVVEEINLESVNLTADHALMQTIATATGGEMLLPSQIEDLPKLIGQREDIKPVIYSHTRYVEMINRWWVLVLIILLLGTEWVTRKYYGEL